MKAADSGGPVGDAQDHQEPGGSTPRVQYLPLFKETGCQVRPLFRHKRRQLFRVKFLFSGWKDHVCRPLRCPDDVEDTLKQFSTPNFMEFGPSFVQIGARRPNLQKLM